jgi:DNA-binding XRE family transcriptional regulator
MLKLSLRRSAMSTLAIAKKKPAKSDKSPGIALFIAMNLLDMRLGAKLTQRQLAAKAKVSLRRVVSIETAGDANVTVLTLSRLAEVLGVKVKDFFKERSDYIRV